jgi:MFS transporter, DHA2 family, multidrug resistance protein
VGPRLLPEYRDPNPGRLDLVSAGMSLVAVLAVIYGLKRIAADGADALAALSIVAGIAVGATFVRRQRRLVDPLIDLRLFSVPAFRVTLTTNTLGFFAAFGISLFIAQSLQVVLGLSPLEAGLWTMPEAAGFIVGSMLAPRLVRRVDPAAVVVGGFLLAAAGFAVLAQAGDLATVVTGSTLMALGLGPVFTLAADLVVGAAPPERAGVASAINETSSEFGGALGIAVLGSIATAAHPGDIAGGLQLAAVISAAIMVAMAVLAARRLRSAGGTVAAAVGA